MKTWLLFFVYLTFFISNFVNAVSSESEPNFQPLYLKQSDLCKNLDLTSVKPNLSQLSKISITPEQINRDYLASLFLELANADPNHQMAALIQLEQLRKDLPEKLEDFWNNSMKQHFKNESNIYIVMEILKWLADHKYFDVLSMDQYIFCDRDETIRDLAIDVAAQSSSRWYLDTFNRLWKKHPIESKRAEIYDFGMRMLALGNDSYELLQTLGSPPSPDQILNIYKANTAFINEKGLLEFFNRVAWMCGSESTLLLKERFEIEHDAKTRRRLASAILVSQLQTGKPQGNDDFSCIPKEEILAKRLPYVEKEIKRLIQPENAKYFELAWAEWDMSSVFGSFKEWGSSIKNPKERIEFWKQVLSLLPQDSKDSQRETLQQLIYAHLSYGGQLMLTNRQAAKQEIALAESLSKDMSMGTEFPRILENMKHWIENKPQAASVNAGDLVGEYRSSRGYDSYKLILKDGNKYESIAQGQGDVINLCPPEPKQGKFVTQGRYLILIPGPHLANYYYGLEAPEVMVPLIWEKNVLLLSDSYAFDGILEFCNLLNSNSTESLTAFRDRYFHKTEDQKSEDSVMTGIPSLPEEWRDCILEEPLEPEVIRVEEKSVLVLNMGHDNGLRVGMWLYLKNPEKFTERALWKISEVDPKESRAIPYYQNPPTIPVGEKLSTRGEIPPDTYSLE